jgi:CspA family cold shock protein
MTALPFPEPLASQWWREVLGASADDMQARERALTHVEDVCRGTVKFFREEKGWGGIESVDTPADVWVHYSDIEGSGYRVLARGAAVEFRWKPTFQDSWRCAATWVRAVD